MHISKEDIQLRIPCLEGFTWFYRGNVMITFWNR